MDSAFSVEISNVIPEGSDWKDVRPYKFLCGSIVDSASVNTLWSADAFYMRLKEYWRFGRMYSWNGVGFDFLTLHDSGVKVIDSFVLGQYDVMFDIYCHLGYPIGLVSVLRGFGCDEEADWLEDEKKELSTLLSEGNKNRIKQYSQKKTRLILETTQRCVDGGGIMWVSKNGKKHMMTLDRFMNVNECVNIPDPDTSWMRDGALTRDDFIGWLGL